MESLGSDYGDLSTPMAAMKKEIKFLEKAQAPAEVQLLQDQPMIQYTLAEIEQKLASGRSRLEELMAKGAEMRSAAVAAGEQRKKELKAELERQLLASDAAMTEGIAHAEEYIKENKKKLEDLIKESTDKKTALKSKAGPLLQQAGTAAASTTGAPAAFIKVASGAIIHSNHLNQSVIKEAMAAAPALAGITPEMAEMIAQITTGLLNQHAMPVPAPAQEETAAQEQTTRTEVAPQPQLQAKPGANVGQDGENVTTRQPEPAQGSQDSSM